jgi:DNA mismatch endonuclease (patch repair protein)
MDTLTTAERSKQMALIRSKNTKPELLVGAVVRSHGYRFRLHCSDLPGKPDLVFPKLKKVIFVHGCFWHGHKCRLGRVPKSHKDYWVGKIIGNHKRDLRTLRLLRRSGWNYLVLWECHLRKRNLSQLSSRILRFLEKPILTPHTPNSLPVNTSVR